MDSFLNQDSGYYTYAGFRSLENLPGNNPYLFLVHSGEEHCRPGHSFGELRNEFHMHFILSGKGTLEMDGTAYQLGPGDLFVIPEGQANYYYADSEDPWYYTWVAFNGSRVWEYLAAAGLGPGKMTRPCYAPTGQYHALIQEILEARSLTRANELRRMGCLYAIFALLAHSWQMSRGEGRVTGYPRDEHINHAIQYLHTNLREATVAGMAEYTGLNRSYISTLFRREVHFAPQEYLTRLRMEKAARMLEGTRRPVNEIADAVGYEDALAFSKAFKRRYGQSPRKYRSVYLRTQPDGELTQEETGG